MAKRVRYGTCKYCGTTGPVEREHVFPKCIFPTDGRDQPILVDSCAKCNREKGRSEGPLRDYLALDVAGSKHPDAERLMHTTIARSVRKGHSPFLRQFAKKAKWKPVYSNGGIYLGHAYQLELGSDDISKAISWIVRGLIGYKHTRHVPEDYGVEVRRFMPHEVNGLRELFSELDFHGPFGVGRSVRFWFSKCSDDEFGSYWIFEFFGGVYLTAYVDRRAFLESQMSEGGLLCPSDID